MIGLKAALPEISGVLGASADALYERQRALVRLGLLEAKEGRGPGSGVELSARALATLIIALMATDSLAETDVRVLRLASAKPAVTYDPKRPDAWTKTSTC